MERRSKKRVYDVEIYTDGSLKKQGANSTFGGWAFIVVKDSNIVYMESGNEYGTTNQRMELQAISEALKYAEANRKNCERVIIYSDSAYAVNCYLKNWYIAWQKNGWVNSQNKEVANKDLWFQIVPFFDNFWYGFQKVEAHKDNFYNNKCDELAQKEADFLKRHWRGTQNYGR